VKRKFANAAKASPLLILTAPCRNKAREFSLYFCRFFAQEKYPMPGQV
jgi:hypothetical protein